jgi:hypothetical protein
LISRIAPLRLQMERTSSGCGSVPTTNTTIWFKGARHAPSPRQLPAADCNLPTDAVSPCSFPRSRSVTSRTSRRVSCLVTGNSRGARGLGFPALCAGAVGCKLPSVSRHPCRPAGFSIVSAI